MDTQELTTLLGFITRSSVAVVLLHLWIVTKRAAKKDGILFRSLTTAWFFLAIPFWLHALCALETLVDFIPGFNLLHFAQRWLWIFHGLAALTAGRFLMVLSRENPK